jgi:hypothetical protein
MGATSTGTPKRVRRVKRDFAIFPTFLTGTCDLCHVKNQPVSEVKLPTHFRHLRWWVVCYVCSQLDPGLMRARAVIQSALAEVVA